MCSELSKKSRGRQDTKFAPSYTSDYNYQAMSSHRATRQTATMTEDDIDLGSARRWAYQKENGVTEGESIRYRKQLRL